MPVLQIFDWINTALSTPLLMDWVLLAAQILVLTYLIVREATRKVDRNLYLILVCLTILLLFQGQAWWTFAQFQGATLELQLNHVISLNGARLANLLLAAATGCFLIGYVTAGRRKHIGSISPRLTTSRVPYIFVTAVTLSAVVGVVALVGGISAAFDNPGRIVGGQALLLILAGMGKIPALATLNRGARPRPYAIGLLALTCIVTLINSRFLLLFILAQVVLISHYRVRPIRRLTLGAGAVAAIVVLLGFGLYRDFAAVTVVDPAIAGPNAFFSQRASQGVVDWFYRLNVEGFTGLAGIVTADQDTAGGINHDYGLSTLAVFPQLVPNSLRNDPALPFKGVADAIASAYPYHASFVPAGFELAYAAFGLVGVLLLGFGLGFASKRIDLVIRARSANGDALMPVVLSVQVLQVVRGTFATSIFFGLGDAAIVTLYRLVAGSQPQRSANKLVGSRSRT